MKRYLPPLLLIFVGAALFIAAPAFGQDDDPVEVVAKAPTWTDPTCENSAGDFTLPDVEGLDYQYNYDYESDEDAPRYFVTVEPLDGYAIGSFAGDFDPDFPHGFDPPIAAGAWVHTYATPSCGDDNSRKKPSSTPGGGLPATGA